MRTGAWSRTIPAIFPLDLRDDPARRARRWVVERIHSWINRYRTMLTRWSKKTENHAALLKFTLALIAWQQLGVLEGN